MPAPGRRFSCPSTLLATSRAVGAQPTPEASAGSLPAATCSANRRASADFLDTFDESVLRKDRPVCRDDGQPILAGTGNRNSAQGVRATCGHPRPMRHQADAHGLRPGHPRLTDPAAASGLFDSQAVRPGVGKSNHARWCIAASRPRRIRRPQKRPNCQQSTNDPIGSAQMTPSDRPTGARGRPDRALTRGPETPTGGERPPWQ